MPLGEKLGTGAVTRGEASPAWPRRSPDGATGCRGARALSRGGGVRRSNSRGVRDGGPGGPGGRPRARGDGGPPPRAEERRNRVEPATTRPASPARRGREAASTPGARTGGGHGECRRGHQPAPTARDVRGTITAVLLPGRVRTRHATELAVYRPPRHLAPGVLRRGGHSGDALITTQGGHTRAWVRRRKDALQRRAVGRFSVGAVLDRGSSRGR